MEKSCEEVKKLLVDYADGQLPTGESSEVAEHLAKCQHCGTTLKALKRSLDLAGIIWEDGLKEIKGTPIPAMRRVSKFGWRRYAAIAAAILIVTGISMIWRTITRPKEPGPTFAEVERRISESASAARLLAAAELLAKYPDAQSIVKKQYSYIVETYPDTAAAAEAKLRIR
jgi:anti-sigma factor RsiW